MRGCRDVFTLCRSGYDSARDGVADRRRLGGTRHARICSPYGVGRGSDSVGVYGERQGAVGLPVQLSQLYYIRNLEHLYAVKNGIIPMHAVACLLADPRRTLEILHLCSVNRTRYGPYLYLQVWISNFRSTVMSTIQAVRDRRYVVLFPGASAPGPIEAFYINHIY